MMNNTNQVTEKIIPFDDDCSKTKFNNLLTNGSICVNSKECIMYFKPGHKFTNKLKLLNMTIRPQIIQIQPLESEIFKFPNPITVSIPPNGSWYLPIHFMSHSKREIKSLLHLKNPTGQENLVIELKAIPKTHCCLPRTINFGNVDIRMSVTRKLYLSSESDPYQFRIFIPYSLEGLSVNPTCGKVLSDSTTEIKVVYTPQSYVTLRVDLLFYFSKDNENPHVVTLTAVTKPKTNSIKLTKIEKTMKTNIDLPPCYDRRRHVTNDDIKVLNRLAVNKILTNKDDISVDSYTWNNPLGELDQLYRKSYMQNYTDFIKNAKCFGDTHKKLHKKIPSYELKFTEEKIKHILDKRLVEWNNYKEKLNSYQNISNNQMESLGYRNRSIRMNFIKTNEHDFDSHSDNNWWVRFQTYNRFVNSVNKIIIRNRLKTRLEILKSIIIKQYEK